MKASTPGVAPQAGLYAGPQLRVQANMGKFVAWGQGAKSTAIGPGTSQAGFHLSSSFRPGITTAYFYTGKALRVPAELPPAVADQLLPLLQPEKDYKGVLTIGPKYGQAHHDDIWIAGDLAYGIRRMVNSNQLPADSPFIAEVIAELTAITRNGKAVNFAFKAKPGSPLEQELATAVPLSFAH